MIGRTKSLEDARRIGYQFCNSDSPRILIYGQDSIKYRYGYTKKTYLISFIKSLNRQKVIFVYDITDGEKDTKGKRITATGKFWKTAKKKQSTVADWERYLGTKLF